MPLTNVTSLMGHGRSAPEPRLRRVCLVEDDIVTRLLVREAIGVLDPTLELEQHGCAEEVLYSGSELRGVELFILDHHLPGMSGAEFARRLRNEYALSTVPLLMLTAERNPKILAEAWEAGISDIATKPVEMYELGLRVKNLVRLGRHPRLVATDRPLRVAVVDDDPAVVIAVGEALRTHAMPPDAHPLDLRVYTNAETAEQALLSHAPETACDLVIIDHYLPGQKGIDLVQRLRDDPRLGALPILVMTGDATLAIKWLAYEAGATEFIVKPFDLYELGLRVRNLLALARAVPL